MHSCPSTVHAAIGVLLVIDRRFTLLRRSLHPFETETTVRTRKKGQMVDLGALVYRRGAVSNGCRDLRRRVKRRSITKRTPIAACTVLGQLCTRATVRPRHSRRGLWCERGGTVPDPFSTVAEHPGPRKGLGKRLGIAGAC